MQNFSPVWILLVQLASINYFYFMWQLEDIVFYKSLSLPWGSFQPQYTCVVWNKWFEISPYFNFYLHYSKTKVKYYGASLCKYQSSKMKLSYHTKGLIDHLWPYLLNFLDYIYFSHFSLQNFFINDYKSKVFKIIKTSLEACFFWHDWCSEMFYDQYSANKITEHIVCK